jgi:hypothetical protein
MANEQKRRRIINSRNAPKSGKTFGGSSVSSTPKESLMNKTGTYRLPSQVTRPDTKFSANEDSIKGKDTSPTKKAPTKQTNFSANEDSLKGKSPPSSSASKSPTPQTNFSADEGSLKSSAKPTPKVPTPEVKFGSTAEKEMRSAANATRGATSKVAELSKTALANKDILKGAGRAATGLGRAAMLEAGPAMLEAGPAIAATVLAGSADKYGRERGFGLQTRDVPKSSMSKKSDSIVDAINAEPKAKATTPDVEIKKTEIVKTAPAVSKPALKSGTSKPKGPTEGDRARNSMADEWAAFSKGREADTAALKDITDRYDKTGTLVNLDDENARTKTEATEAMKKGGMTKRPPKPAKKVPPRKFASGGSTSRTSASKRGDGCATKGHTKGKYL